MGVNLNNVVFSDAKKFNLDDPDGYSYYVDDIRKGKIFSTRRMSSDYIMVWVSFAQHGKSDLVFI